MSRDDETPTGRPLRLHELAASALWALLGVQKEANRRRDFSRGRPGQFVLIGVIATVLFVLLLIGLVRLALGLAGA
ncbi:DUF2970 domain-containing protein [Plasticicumulans sp.]|uniref:DUF2970 domain-containing protein n=1 Tax=Plasticicumulans sp. TaxID=2307179 RepID=UPI00393E47A4|nr:DUF2970 domain-containing protein [Pseudomonadota bacterium]